MGWGQCDVEGGRLPETLLCFALQGDRGVPGPEGEKVGVLGQLWHGGLPFALHLVKQDPNT